jgi:hypothetical protein
VDDAECCDVKPGAPNQTEGTVGGQQTHGNERSYPRGTHNVNRPRHGIRRERDGVTAELPHNVKKSVAKVKHRRRTVIAS